MGERRFVTSADMNLYDYDVAKCNRLLFFGIIESGHHYNIDRVRSVSVMKWLVDHDMIVHNAIITTILFRALYSGGPYIDVLHYLVEQAHIPVPRDILARVGVERVIDLVQLII